jgi:hypothetical protein
LSTGPWNTGAAPDRLLGTLLERRCGSPEAKPLSLLAAGAVVITHRASESAGSDQARCRHGLQDCRAARRPRRTSWRDADRGAAPGAAGLTTTSPPTGLTSAHFPDCRPAWRTTPARPPGSSSGFKWRQTFNWPATWLAMRPTLLLGTGLGPRTRRHPRWPTAPRVVAGGASRRRPARSTRRSAAWATVPSAGWWASSTWPRHGCGRRTPAPCCSGTARWRPAWRGPRSAVRRRRELGGSRGQVMCWCCTPTGSSARDRHRVPFGVAGPAEAREREGPDRLPAELVRRRTTRPSPVLLR